MRLVTFTQEIFSESQLALKHLRPILSFLGNVKGEEDLVFRGFGVYFCFVCLCGGLVGFDLRIEEDFFFFLLLWE